MSGALDYFADMLGPGEQIAAILGGNGPSTERPMGVERSWYQLAVTQSRFLVVKMLQSPLGGAYQVTNRFAAGKEFVRIGRYPRTPASVARLEISGFPEPVLLLDIDDSKIFPYVEPFLQAWGGQTEGLGALASREADPYDAVPPTDDRKKLIYLAVGGFMLLFFCCGCGGILSIVRLYVIPAIEAM